MKTIKTTLKSLPAIIISIIVVVGITYAAGSLTAPTGTPSATGYTLGDIYNKLTDFSSSATEDDHDLSTTTDPATSFASLTEVYELLINEDSDLVAGNIATGTTIFGVTGNLYSAQTLKTDVTTCHNSGGSPVSCTGAGQDGEYQTGLTKSFTDNGNETVTDNNTGLMWAKCSNGLSGSSCGTGTATTTSWYNAIVECENSTLAGHTDWRLPNINELYTIVSFNASSPSISSSVFPATFGGPYWSSTYNTGANVAFALQIDFSYGRATDSIKTTLYRSRCVR